MALRTAIPDDIAQICRVDTDASSNFASIPALADLADGSHGPLEASKVREWLETGHVWVVAEDCLLLGFIAVQSDDGVLYVAELSVRVSQQGKGLGSLLLEKVFEKAREMARDQDSRVAKVSLTTYPDVPWNGPWYRKRGFWEVDAETLGPWHVGKVRQDEEDLVRPGFRRCCMLREENTDTSPRT